jgi:hypothetical protein
MGFRKSLYDVEEKGLDPTKPHNELGIDGRLASVDDSSDTPAASELKEDLSASKASKKKAALVQVEEAMTLTSETSGEENASAKDTDKLPNALKELPKKSEKPKSKQVRKRRTSKTKTKKTTPKRKPKKEDT